MNVIVVDDERIVLAAETAVIAKSLPDAEVRDFRDAFEAIEYAGHNKVDIAFLDINMRGCDGLELAKRLQALYPKVNVIFCTGYPEYSLEAFELYASAFLVKPLSPERIKDAVEHLRYPKVSEKKRVSVRCFGNFEVLCDGAPIKFKYARTKEFLAYLIDRKGTLGSTNEVMAAMFGDEDKGSYMRNMKADLISTFQQLGVGDIIVQNNKQIGIICDRISCDYFDYLDGETELFKGEYMSQYSFGEVTLARLIKIYDK